MIVDVTLVPLLLGWDRTERGRFSACGVLDIVDTEDDDTVGVRGSVGFEWWLMGKPVANAGEADASDDEDVW